MSTMMETLPETVQMRGGHAAQAAQALPAVQEFGKDRNVSEVDGLTIGSTSSLLQNRKKLRDDVCRPVFGLFTINCEIQSFKNHLIP